MQDNSSNRRSTCLWKRVDKFKIIQEIKIAILFFSSNGTARNELMKSWVGQPLG